MNVATSLPTASGSGDQASTQDPQTSSTYSGLGNSTTPVQQGTATSLLNSTSGTILQNNGVPSVSLSTATHTATTPKISTPHHALNPVLIVIAVVFFVLAIGLFASTFRSAKNTTA